MTGSVIVRFGTEVVDQTIEHDDRPLAWEEADQRAGFRLDRRKAWAFVEGELCEIASWTQACSGCRYGFEDRGSGCRECGYRGVTREAMWIPAPRQRDQPARAGISETNQEIEHERER